MTSLRHEVIYRSECWIRVEKQAGRNQLEPLSRGVAAGYSSGELSRASASRQGSICWWLISRQLAKVWKVLKRYCK